MYFQGHCSEKGEIHTESEPLSEHTSCCRVWLTCKASYAPLVGRYRTPSFLLIQYSIRFEYWGPHNRTAFYLSNQTIASKDRKIISCSMLKWTPKRRNKFVTLEESNFLKVQHALKIKKKKKRRASHSTWTHQFLQAFLFPVVPHTENRWWKEANMSASKIIVYLYKEKVSLLSFFCPGAEMANMENDNTTGPNYRLTTHNKCWVRV